MTKQRSSGLDPGAAREAMQRVGEAREQALAAARELARRHDDLAARLAEAAAERDEAIRLAVELGVSHRAIAEQVGVTRARVAQIAGARKAGS